ncbi:helix-turn-helix domain-containing protein [Neoroseomonas lacus]|uniref:HTH araC/xylS-type domain-containing protein n=1 Tax=Neoroseomonas lacus TaxID=287609 RepID=A0A917NKL5_9PROT|nr:AraC family transcriptional regulator [Neoroseomonas lacus]GGJ04835.1 hypothetical protein GCM10011320_09690 [Neoroseomonas lacus]
MHAIGTPPQFPGNWQECSTQEVSWEQSIPDGRMDLAIMHFARAILPEDQAEEVIHGYYTEAFHGRLMECLSALRVQPRLRGGRRISPLPRWKLRKVVMHIDANIGDRILLAEVASHVGLSAMHFAAQFRLAAGQRLHDYVTHRRILVARQLLHNSREPIVQIALAVGFQTQAHFTTVFKRVVGVTPNQWRRGGRDETAAGASFEAGVSSPTETNAAASRF